MGSGVLGVLRSGVMGMVTLRSGVMGVLIHIGTVTHIVGIPTGLDGDHIVDIPTGLYGDGGIPTG